ncbi:ADP-ribosylation factor family-domain-containing protein [Pelagophyceae sp. CCMP2097]|nr:ADP-ribosylation factor family-domain-containing protein [Pelagophyceae sp. CCMP2097]
MQRLSNALFKKPEVHILVVGLDNSGKSSLINYMKPETDKRRGEAKFEATPTVGFEVEKFAVKHLSFTCFDMSGQSRYRELWENYYPGVEAFIFVIDSSERIRLCVVKDELECLLQHQDVKETNIPILFFANKMDLPGSMTPEECATILELDRIQSRPWHIAPCSAVRGSGVDDGLEWLAANIVPKTTHK